MKLSQLTPEQKTRLLAELDGRLDLCDHILKAWSGSHCTDVVLHREHLDYLTSYDAIIPLVQKLGRGNITIQIQMILSGITCDIYATPSQISDAVLITTGKAEL